MKGIEMNDKPVWVQYVVTWEHINSIPRQIQRDCMQLGGCLSPLVYQSWDLSNDTSITAPGYRPPDFRGNALAMEGRKGDWVVLDAHTYSADEDGPYRAIIVCTVEYQPLPQHDHQWATVNNILPDQDTAPDRELASIA